MYPIKQCPLKSKVMMKMGRVWSPSKWVGLIHWDSYVNRMHLSQLRKLLAFGMVFLNVCKTCHNLSLAVSTYSQWRGGGGTRWIYRKVYSLTWKRKSNTYRNDCVEKCDLIIMTKQIWKTDHLSFQRIKPHFFPLVKKPFEMYFITSCKFLISLKIMMTFLVIVLEWAGFGKLIYVQTYVYSFISYLSLTHQLPIFAKCFAMCSKLWNNCNQPSSSSKGGNTCLVFVIYSFLFSSLILFIWIFVCVSTRLQKLSLCCPDEHCLIIESVWMFGFHLTFGWKLVLKVVSNTQGCE